ncbi:MAG: class I SAM-dependent methyltransferase [Chitinophagales bacterium]
MNIHTLALQNFPDYELIDCGNFLKLERFGQYITIRPEPQAVWDSKLSLDEWKKLAHVSFVSKSSSSGEWQKLKNMPDNWNIKYQFRDKKSIQFNLALTKFKHVGVFPEQCVNWEFIYDRTKQILQQNNTCNVLNLFAYTGGASLAARTAGADVWHIDAIKQVVSWANRNMESSNLDNIRWVVEDALKFVKREVKRGKKYHGIILDPPAFGHGPNGESWKLENQINELLHDVIRLLDVEHQFMILNVYSLGFSSLIVENLVQINLDKNDVKISNMEIGEIYIPSQQKQKLPLGVYCRF